MRIDKLLEANQVGSKTAIKQLIRDGLVTVDGRLIRQLNHTVDPGFQQICLKGQPLKGPAHQYWLLYKPTGVVTAVRDSQWSTVLDLIPEAGPKVFPVGRLDRDSEGLLLLTDNGQLGRTLLYPEKKVHKTYHVTVKEPLEAGVQQAFAEGIIFTDGTRCLPAPLTILTAHTALVEIQEGKRHQVKKMFLACGKKVLQLKRIAMGPLKLDQQAQPGTYRKLNQRELQSLVPYFEGEN